MDGSNFAHLRSKYPSAEFKVYGTPSVGVAVEQRLHVAIQVGETCALEKVAEDVVDLVETAIDVCADALDLSDDAVQQAFEDIRVDMPDAAGILAVAVGPGGDALPSAPPPPPAGARTASSGLTSKGVTPFPPPGLAPPGATPFPPPAPTAVKSSSFGVVMPGLLPQFSQPPPQFVPPTGPPPRPPSAPSGSPTVMP